MIPTGVIRKNQSLSRHSGEINGYHIFAKLVKKIFSADLLEQLVGFLSRSNSGGCGAGSKGVR